MRIYNKKYNGDWQIILIENQNQYPTITIIRIKLFKLLNIDNNILTKIKQRITSNYINLVHILLKLRNKINNSDQTILMSLK